MNDSKYAIGDLAAFCRRALETVDVPPEEARITADALCYADRRGVDTHGIQLLPRYVDAIERGECLARREITIVHETPSTALVDGGGGLGHPASASAMRIAMEKCATGGSSCVGVRNSKHYGAAGYYAAMALERDMIGFCLTNAGPGVLPTFGIEPQVGTNPIALAIPANEEPPFVLDMATSVRASNKLKLLARAGKPVPDGWLLDEEGNPCHDPEFFSRWNGSERLGGLLPLGGAEERTAGYKGYGLSLAVELLTGVLVGDVPSAFMDVRPETPEPSISHFFAAIRIDAFRPAVEFKEQMDRLLAHIKASPKLPGHDRIFVAGEKEFECRLEREAHGVPLHDELVEELDALARRLNLPFADPIEEHLSDA